MKHSVSVVPGSSDALMAFLKSRHLDETLGEPEYSFGEIDGCGRPYDLLQFQTEDEIPDEVEYLVLAMDEVLVTTFNIEEKMDALRSALESFLDSSEFGESLIKATKALWSGKKYCVELFEDGSFRVLWEDQIGNRYRSPGAMLDLPTLDDDDYQEAVIEGGMSEEEFFFAVLQNDQEELEQQLRDALAREG